MNLRKTGTEFVCRARGAELLRFGFTPQEIMLCEFDRNQKCMSAMASYMFSVAVDKGILDNVQEEYSAKLTFIPIQMCDVVEAVVYDVMITVWGMESDWLSDSKDSQQAKKKEALRGLVFRDWKEIFEFYRATRGLNYRASLYKLYNQFYLVVETGDTFPTWVMYEFSLRQLKPTIIPMLKEHGDCIIKDFISELSLL